MAIKKIYRNIGATVIIITKSVCVRNHVEAIHEIYSNLLPLRKILKIYRNKQHNGEASTCIYNYGSI